MIISNKYMVSRRRNRVSINPNVAYVYIIAGQSNAQGNGSNVASLPDYLKAKLGAKIFHNPSLNSTGTWQNLLAGTNQSNTSSSTILSVVGPETSFAYEMDQYRPGHIYIIKHTKGGSPLEGTGVEDDWDPDSVGELYRDLMIATVNVGLGKLVAEGKTVIVKGFIWMQGEDDAVSAGALYYNNLVYFFDQVKSYLNGQGYGTDQMKIHVGRIHNNFQGAALTARPDLTLVRQAQEDFGNNYTNADWYNTDDLPVQNDYTHWTTPGQITHGQRNAAFFKQFI
jgi:hypothetical protein